MTDSRRKSIQEVMDAIDWAISEINDLMSDEQESFDSLPLGRQLEDSDYQMLDAIENLDGAVDELRDAKGYLEEALA